MNSSRIAERTIEYTFYILIFLVPIIWLPITSELFEFNKMILVYFGASIILTAWLFKSVTERAFTLKRTALDVPILLFLFANIASTLFSIDQHSSIFGAYSRFNGGLLSTVSYIILYYALVTFFDREKLFNLLKILLLSSVVVAIYAILQHPTPLFRNPDGSFRGIDAGYWKQNAEARAFSTLGHPNWLAAFMAMLVPVVLLFLILVRRTWEKILFTALLAIYFLAFTFTYSRGGTVGFVVMILTFILGIAIAFRKELLKVIRLSGFSKLLSYLKPPNVGFFVALVLISWFIIFQFFGNAFTTRGVNIEAIKAEGDTQLAQAGPETGRIRMIVWEGGLDIFKNYPIFGSGVETFALSYYQFRPEKHNYTSEADFVYNKAHNEFVNFIATTGGVGLFTYLVMIGTFGVLLLLYLSRKAEAWKKIFVVSIAAGYAGYHAQNIFGFSVVPIALLFFLAPAFFFIASELRTEAKIDLPFFEKTLYSRLAKIGVLLVGTGLIFAVSTMWLADVLYNKGNSSSNYSEGYKNLKLASNLRPDEPLYKAYLGLTTMYLAEQEKGEKKQARIAESFRYLNQATSTSPANVGLWKIRLQAIYDLATDDEKYIPQVVDTAEILSQLAPTDSLTQYELGSMYVLAQDYQRAQKQLEKVVDIKFNYQDAWELLFKVDAALEDEQAQKAHFEEFKEIFPELAEDKEYLNGLDLIY